MFLLLSLLFSSVYDGLPVSFDRKQPKVRKFHLSLLLQKTLASIDRADVQCQHKQSEVILEQVAVCSDFSLTVLASQTPK